MQVQPRSNKPFPKNPGVVVSEVAKRSSLFAALIASLLLTSLLAVITYFAMVQVLNGFNVRLSEPRRSLLAVSRPPAAKGDSQPSHSVTKGTCVDLKKLRRTSRAFDLAVRCL